MAETFEAHTTIISNHPAYHLWLTLYMWRCIGSTLDRIARWRKPVHVIRVEFNFPRTRDARVGHRACIFTRVIRTTRWKRMDKERRGQEPWTTFRLPIRIPSIHRCITTFDTGAANISLHSYICWCIRKIYVRGRSVTRRFLELVYTCVFRSVVETVKKIGCWLEIVGGREREEEVGGVLDGTSGKAIVKWGVMCGECEDMCEWWSD